MEKMNMEILKLLFSKRKLIIIITVIGAFLSGVSSYLIKPQFKSMASVYPANIEPYSEETPTEQLMQFFSSKDVRDELLKRFDLAKHYKLDTSDMRFETYYTYYFDERFKISQTRYESIQLEVLDEDPVFAQKLVYGLIDAVNSHIRLAKNQKKEEFNNMHKLFFESRRKKMDSVDLLLRQFNDKYGVNDYTYRILNASKYYYKAIPEGRVDKLEQYMDKLAKQGIEETWKERKTIIWSEQYKIYMGDYNASMQEYEKGIRDIEKKFTYTIISSKPNLPDSKSTPKRTIMLSIGALGSFLFACIFFIGIDRYKRIKEQLV